MAFPDDGLQGGIGPEACQIFPGQGQEGVGPGQGHPEPVGGAVVWAQPLHKFSLPQNGLGMLEEGGALLRRLHAPAGPLENGKAQRILRLPQDPAQIWLAHIQVFRRQGNGTSPLDFRQVE